MIGSSSALSLRVEVRNIGEDPAYFNNVTITMPQPLSAIRLPQTPGWQCDEETWDVQYSTVICNLDNPIKSGRRVSFYTNFLVKNRRRTCAYRGGVVVGSEG